VPHPASGCPCRVLSPLATAGNQRSFSRLWVAVVVAYKTRTSKSKSRRTEIPARAHHPLPIAVCVWISIRRSPRM